MSIKNPRCFDGNVDFFLLADSGGSGKHALHFFADRFD